MRSAKSSSILGNSSQHLAKTALAMAAACACGASAWAAPKETGIWIDDTGKGAVRIEICTETTLCGRIVWIKDPHKKNGEPLTDELNPEPSKRSRPICGLQVLGGLEKTSDGGFDNGWVYDPKRGQQFSVALDLLSNNKLKVTGYKGMRLFGQSFVWTRAPADLPTCSKDDASANPKAEKSKADKKKSKTAKADKHKNNAKSSAAAGASRVKKTASESE